MEYNKDDIYLHSGLELDRLYEKLEIPETNRRIKDEILRNIKKSGLFDKIRKKCVADIDQKSMYQNLHFRTSEIVNGFLSSQIWHTGIRKNYLRDALRQYIYDSAQISNGIMRVSESVVITNLYDLKDYLEPLQDIVCFASDIDLKFFRFMLKEEDDILASQISFVNRHTSDPYSFFYPPEFTPPENAICPPLSRNPIYNNASSSLNHAIKIHLKIKYKSNKKMNNKKLEEINNKKPEEINNKKCEKICDNNLKKINNKKCEKISANNLKKINNKKCEKINNKKCEKINNKKPEKKSDKKVKHHKKHHKNCFIRKKFKKKIRMTKEILSFPVRSQAVLAKINQQIKIDKKRIHLEKHTVKKTISDKIRKKIVEKISRNLNKKSNAGIIDKTKSDKENHRNLSIELKKKIRKKIKKSRKFRKRSSKLRKKKNYCLKFIHKSDNKNKEVNILKNEITHDDNNSKEKSTISESDNDNTINNLEINQTNNITEKKINLDKCLIEDSIDNSNNLKDVNSSEKISIIHTEVSNEDNNVIDKNTKIDTDVLKENIDENTSLVKDNPANSEANMSITEEIPNTDDNLINTKIESIIPLDKSYKTTFNDKIKLDTKSISKSKNSKKHRNKRKKKRKRKLRKRKHSKVKNTTAIVLKSFDFKEPINDVHKLKYTLKNRYSIHYPIGKQFVSGMDRELEKQRLKRQNIRYIPDTTYESAALTKIKSDIFKKMQKNLSWENCKKDILEREATINQMSEKKNESFSDKSNDQNLNKKFYEQPMCYYNQTIQEFDQVRNHNLMYNLSEISLPPAEFFEIAHLQNAINPEIYPIRISNAKDIPPIPAHLQLMSSNYEVKEYSKDFHEIPSAFEDDIIDTNEIIELDKKIALSEIDFNELPPIPPSIEKLEKLINIIETNKLPSTHMLKRYEKERTKLRNKKNGVKIDKHTRHHFPKKYDTEADDINIPLDLLCNIPLPVNPYLARPPPDFEHMNRQLVDLLDNKDVDPVLIPLEFFPPDGVKTAVHPSDDPILKLLNKTEFAPEGEEPGDSSTEFSDTDMEIHAEITFDDTVDSSSQQPYADVVDQSEDFNRPPPGYYNGPPRFNNYDMLPQQNYMPMQPQLHQQQQQQQPPINCMPQMRPQMNRFMSPMNRFPPQYAPFDGPPGFPGNPYNYQPAFAPIHIHPPGMTMNPNLRMPMYPGPSMSHHHQQHPSNMAQITPMMRPRMMQSSMQMMHGNAPQNMMHNLPPPPPILNNMQRPPPPIIENLQMMPTHVDVPMDSQPMEDTASKMAQHRIATELELDLLEMMSDTSMEKISEGSDEQDYPSVSRAPSLEKAPPLSKEEIAIMIKRMQFHVIHNLKFKDDASPPSTEPKSPSPPPKSPSRSPPQPKSTDPISPRKSRIVYSKPDSPTSPDQSPAPSPHRSPVPKGPIYAVGKLSSESDSLIVIEDDESSKGVSVIEVNSTQSEYDTHLIQLMQQQQHRQPHRNHHHHRRHHHHRGAAEHNHNDLPQVSEERDASFFQSLSHHPLMLRRNSSSQDYDARRPSDRFPSPSQHPHQPRTQPPHQPPHQLPHQPQYPQPPNRRRHRDRGNSFSSNISSGSHKEREPKQRYNKQQQQQREQQRQQREQSKSAEKISKQSCRDERRRLFTLQHEQQQREKQVEQQLVQKREHLVQQQRLEERQHIEQKQLEAKQDLEHIPIGPRTPPEPCGDGGVTPAIVPRSPSPLIEDCRGPRIPKFASNSLRNELIRQHSQRMQEQAIHSSTLRDLDEDFSCDPDTLPPLEDEAEGDSKPEPHDDDPQANYSQRQHQLDVVTPDEHASTSSKYSRERDLQVKPVQRRDRRKSPFQHRDLQSSPMQYNDCQSSSSQQRDLYSRPPNRHDRRSRPPQRHDRNPSPSQPHDLDSRPPYRGDRQSRNSQRRDLESRPSQPRDLDSRPAHQRDHQSRPPIRRSSTSNNRELHSSSSQPRDLQTNAPHQRDHQSRPPIRRSSTSNNRDMHSSPSQPRDHHSGSSQPRDLRRDLQQRPAQRRDLASSPPPQADYLSSSSHQHQRDRYPSPAYRSSRFPRQDKRQQRRHSSTHRTSDAERNSDASRGPRTPPPAQKSPARDPDPAADADKVNYHNRELYASLDSFSAQISAIQDSDISSVHTSDLSSFGSVDEDDEVFSTEESKLASQVKLRRNIVSSDQPSYDQTTSEQTEASHSAMIEERLIKRQQRRAQLDSKMNNASGSVDDNNKKKVSKENKKAVKREEKCMALRRSRKLNTRYYGDDWATTKSKVVPTKPVPKDVPAQETEYSDVSSDDEFLITKTTQFIESSKPPTAAVDTTTGDVAANDLKRKKTGSSGEDDKLEAKRIRRPISQVDFGQAAKISRNNSFQEIKKKTWTNRYLRSKK